MPPAHLLLLLCTCLFKSAGLFSNRPAFLGEEGKPTGLTFWGGAPVPCVCGKLVDHTWHAWSTVANEILWNTGSYCGQIFSGEDSWDREVLWNIIGIAPLLWNSKRYQCHVSLQASSKTLCTGYNFYFEKDHRSSLLFLLPFGLLLNPVLNLRTTKLFEPDFLPYS